MHTLVHQNNLQHPLEIRTTLLKVTVVKIETLWKNILTTHVWQNIPIDGDATLKIIQGHVPREKDNNADFRWGLLNVSGTIQSPNRRFHWTRKSSN